MNQGDFTITFEDHTLFKGNLINKDWRRVPLKNIKRLELIFGGHYISLYNYEEYDLTKLIINILQSKLPFKEINILGRKQNITEGYRFNLSKKICQEVTLEKYKEYDNLISETWKPGIKNGTPSKSIKKI